MIRTLTITAAIIAASITPALADGKEATIASVNMVIADNDCGLKLPSWASDTAGRSLEFTGLTAEQWASSVGDMAVVRSQQMYADKSIGRFCARMAQIYAGMK